MDPNSTASIVAAGSALAAAGAALVALPFTARAANAARHQTALQREIAQQAAQPYVWADIRPNDAQGWNLEFVIGNSGQTLATDVRVNVDPMPPLLNHNSDLTKRAFERLGQGVRALAPGARIAWTLGAAPRILERAEPQPIKISIDAHGPFGPLDTLQYTIDLADFRESDDSPQGSLHQLTQAVRAIEKKIE